MHRDLNFSFYFELPSYMLTFLLPLGFYYHPTEYSVLEILCSLYYESPLLWLYNVVYVYVQVF